ncbi:MAG: T9SS type A sorting domain-containing protein [Candidatus Zixiibacteriota bacterium]
MAKRLMILAILPLVSMPGIVSLSDYAFDEGVCADWGRGYDWFAFSISGPALAVEIQENSSIVPENSKEHEGLRNWNGAQARKSSQEYSRGFVTGPYFSFCCCYYGLEPDPGYTGYPCLCPSAVDLGPFVGVHVEIWGYLQPCVEDGSPEFHVTQLQTITAVDDETESQAIPRFTLNQNHPNPFNPVTTIRYTIGGGQGSTHTKLKIYDLLGRKIKTLVNEEQTAGIYEVSWDGKDDLGREVASGVYFYRLETPEFSQTRKMLLLK